MLATYRCGGQRLLRWPGAAALTMGLLRWPWGRGVGHGAAALAVGPWRWPWGRGVGRGAVALVVGLWRWLWSGGVGFGPGRWLAAYDGRLSCDLEGELLT